jgi:hypothetical protein
MWVCLSINNKQTQLLNLLPTYRITYLTCIDTVRAVAVPCIWYRDPFCRRSLSPQVIQRLVIYLILYIIPTKMLSSALSPIVVRESRCGPLYSIQGPVLSSEPFTTSYTMVSNLFNLVHYTNKNVTLSIIAHRRPWEPSQSLVFYTGTRSVVGASSLLGFHHKLYNGK